MAPISHRDIQLALRSVLVTVSPLPQDTVWENVGTYQPKPDRTYLTEQYVPATSQLLTTTACGEIEHRGLYFVGWFGLTGQGLDAIRSGSDAILAAFYPGRSIISPAGRVVRVRGDQAPASGQIIRLEEGGHSYVMIAIPWIVHTSNPS